MITVSEATFARRVLRAALPVLVCFGARACPGRQALRPALERLSAAYQGRLEVATLQLDDAPLLAEQCGVAMSPTLVAFEHGERLGQAIGFLPAGLLDLLAEDILGGALTGGRLWSPVEERFEDAVLLPLLRGWGLVVERQVACVLPGRNRAQRGRIDLLVRERADGPPLTLIESKRQIRDGEELRRAAEQAAAYAHSLALPAWIVAAPRGLWAYAQDGERTRCISHLTSLALHQRPEALRPLVAGPLGSPPSAR